MTWLSPASAASIGLAVHVYDANGTEQPEGEQPLLLPKGYRWIVIASTRTAADLPKLPSTLAQYPSLVVTTNNGHVASVVGPFTEAVARSIIELGLAPADAFLSSGRGFAAQMK